MKKMIVGGLAAGAVALGLAAAGPAHADTVSTDTAAQVAIAAAQFTSDLSNAGFYNQRWGC